MDHVNLGPTDTKVSAIGLGTWAWGDWYWRYGTGYGKDDVVAAFNKPLEMGVNFIDTAEVYGLGSSERMIGEVIKGRREELFIVTKYFPLHIFASSIIKAADRSLERLQIRTIDLYLIHWPSPIMPIPAMMKMMEKLVEEGKVRYIGVSNFNPRQLEETCSSLKHETLAAIEVEYNLLHRTPERNGLLKFCRDNKISLIAHSPLAQGLLTGKYTSQSKAVNDFRMFTGGFSQARLRRAEALLDILRKTGDKYGKLVSQVSLNWLIHDQIVVPIPGAKNAQQAAQNAGSAGWRLSDSDWAALESASADLNPF